MKTTRKDLLDLFLTFFKIGAFTFGGGYAMISIMEEECVTKKKWLAHEEMMDIAVVAESTPGPLAINTATFVGYRRGGFFGALLATTGVVLPSLVLLFIIARFLDRFLEIRWVASAFRGIKAAVAYLIIAAGLKMLRKMKKSVFHWVVFVASLAVMLLVNFGALRFSSIYLILLSALAGLVSYLLSLCRERGKKS